MNAYFAHPYFTDTQRQKADQLRTILNDFSRQSPQTLGDFGLKILNPFDYTPAIEGDREAKRNLSKFVLSANISLLKSSHLLIAVIDDRDQGVIWEMGYAAARGIPTISVSYQDFDTNIMLGASVIAHIPNVLEKDGAMLRSVLSSQMKLSKLKARTYV